MGCRPRAFTRPGPSLYSILISLEPAAAALAAVLIIDDQLSALQWLAVPPREPADAAAGSV